MKKIFVLLLVSFSIAALQIGCSDNSTDPKPIDNSDIPRDPGGNAPATVFNNITPAAQFSRTQGNESRIRINLLGLVDRNGNPILPQSGNPFIFVTEDNVLKGNRVSRPSATNQLAADVVFVVDNSGSMGDEADSIASKIIAFSTLLTNSGLNIQVGCVGYDGNVTGALNFTNAQTLRTYLNRSTGTSRTEGFSGNDSARFRGVAQTYASGVSGENGVVGVSFADSLFAWRAGAQRVYINFTDEPTQPDNLIFWSSEGLCARWSATRGTIHTVWSGRDTTGLTWTRLVDERPWEMSNCTGGTFVRVNDNSSDLDLTRLPVTGALANSLFVEFLTANPNIPHNLSITVKRDSTDGRSTYPSIRY
jgi:hypothetical protein